MSEVPKKLPSIRQRGRPPGKGARINKRWNPAKWEPLYEHWVSLSAMGVSNVDIAKQFRYTPQQVSNVLTCDKAKVIKELLVREVRKGMLEDTKSQREAIIQRAQSNIKAVLTDDELLDRSPFKMLEASMAYLKGVGSMETEGGVKNTTINISTQVANVLAMGLEKANEAKLLNAENKTP